MMQVEELYNLKVTVFDTGGHTIGLTRKALMDTGFKNIVLVREADALGDNCLEGGADMLIADFTHTPRRQEK